MKSQLTNQVTALHKAILATIDDKDHAATKQLVEAECLLV